MKNLQKHLRAAIVQAAPVLFDKKATLEKVVRQIQEATANGAELIVFPESLVPCYPYGLTFGFTVGSRKEEGRKDWKVYYDNAVLVPDDTVSLAAAAKKARAWVSIGVTERDPVNCSLYCTNLVFSPEGKLASVHRKIKPTGSERYIWADSHVPETYFPVVDTPWGRMGSLICWENYMPLARVALYQKGFPCTWHPTPTTIRNGRTPSGTLPSKATAMCSMWTSTSPGICIRLTCWNRKRLAG